MPITILALSLAQNHTFSAWPGLCSCFRAFKTATNLAATASDACVISAGDARLTETCIAATARVRALAAQLGLRPQALVDAVDVHGRADAASLPATTEGTTAATSIVAAAAAGKDITF